MVAMPLIYACSIKSISVSCILNTRQLFPFRMNVASCEGKEEAQLLLWPKRVFLEAVKRIVYRNWEILLDENFIPLLARHAILYPSLTYLGLQTDKV